MNLSGYSHPESRVLVRYTYCLREPSSREVSSNFTMLSPTLSATAKRASENTLSVIPARPSSLGRPFASSPYSQLAVSSASPSPAVGTRVAYMLVNRRAYPSLGRIFVSVVGRGKGARGGGGTPSLAFALAL